jgi:preprotein translocase subunit SecD
MELLVIVLIIAGVIGSMAVKETKRVSRLLTIAREREMFPWWWIVDEHREIEEVISVATIRGVFSSRFQITGLQPQESRNLALLLRAGALAAPMDIVEERTVGPSMGADNIRQGFNAVAIGFLAVILFVALYYRKFGFVANAARRGGMYRRTRQGPGI